MKSSGSSGGLWSAAGLVVVLSVLAVRMGVIEGFGETLNLALMNFSDRLKTLSFSFILIAVVAIGLIKQMLGGELKFSSSKMLPGLVLFIVACVVSSFFASDKRIAINSSIAFVSVMLSAIFLVNVLDSKTRITIVLIVLTGLGVVNAFKCFEQMTMSNADMISQYEQSPDEQLSRLGIEKDTLEHFMYEHRLYSKDINGYFTTGNSAASFFLLSICASGLLVMSSWSDRKKDMYLFICSVAALLIILAGMILTHSKGGIGGLFIIVVLFGLYRVFGGIVRRYRFAIFMLGLVGIVVVGGFIVSYGLKNDKLPGGNSMLVRWQYWKGAWQGIGDNPFGMGGGNFKTNYLMYKPAEASETVADPHNFILSLISQFGWLGLAGFLIAVGWPVLRVMFSKADVTLKDRQEEKQEQIRIRVFIVIALLMAIGWVIGKKVEMPDDLSVAVYIAFVIFVIPTFIFAITCFLIRPRAIDENSKTFDSSLLICGMLGFFVHNLIDFAIFEPSVWMTFWIVLATVVANDNLLKGLTLKKIKLKVPIKIVGTILALAVLVVMIASFYVPVSRTTALMSGAGKEYESLFKPSIKLWSGGEKLYIEQAIDRANSKLKKAWQIDGLDPMAASVNGRWLLGIVRLIGPQQKYLDLAREAFVEASQKDERNFKHYHSLARVNNIEGDIKKDSQLWESALVAILKAVEFYPADGGLHFELAELAEKLGKIDLAVKHYKKSVEIEDAFARQFKIMYPDIEVVSRMGKDKYQEAASKTSGR